MSAETKTTTERTWPLPGDGVFPESVGVDPSTGDAYVGSLADGALYRLAGSGEVELFSPAGEDGRRSVAGVKVDARGRLWAAGGYEGTLHVYELTTGSLLAQLDVGARPSCVNDIAFGPGGEAYVTDSLVSLLFRVAGEPLRLEPWVDLAEQGVPWGEGLNFNGIVMSADRRHLVACQTNLGRFWRVALDSGRVTEVALDCGPIKDCDGMARSGSALYVAINARNRIAVIELADDGAAGVLRTMLTNDDFAFPTAVAVHGEDLLVVNAQLDRMGGAPQIPFTAIAIPVPPAG